MDLAKTVAAFAMLSCSSTSPPAGGDAEVNETSTLEAGRINHVANPAVIAGGGVGGGIIDGEVNVFVIDARTGMPIPGARVRVGKELNGDTSASGLITFTDAKVHGAQTITAQIVGYAATTWIGANGAVVTLPMEPLGAPPTADVEGTIAGWASLMLPQGHYYVAFVKASARLPLGSPENFLPQPPPVNGLAANACVRSQTSSTCNWKMKVRTGKQLHVAVVLDADAKGTPSDTSDDTFTVAGYAALSNLSFSAGQMVSEQLATITTTKNATFGFQTPPFQQPKMVALPAIDMGDQGLAFLGVLATTLSPSIPVPTLGGAFAGGKYDAVATAVPNAATAPSSMNWQHDADIGATVDLGAWLLPSKDVTVNGRTIAFTPVSGATVHGAAIRDSNGQLSWNLLVLDETTAFGLPITAPDALPVGNATIALDGIDVPGFDPTNFSVTALERAMHRAAATTFAFVH